MKHIIYILSFVLILSGCFGTQTNIEEAKKDLGVTSGTSSGSENTTHTPSSQTPISPEINTIDEKDTQQDDEVARIKKIYTIEYLDDNKYIELGDLEGENFYDGRVELSWRTLTHVDKIVVQFRNSSSSYPDDDYTLRAFKSGMLHLYIVHLSNIKHSILE